MTSNAFVTHPIGCISQAVMAGFCWGEKKGGGGDETPASHLIMGLRSYLRKVETGDREDFDK